MPEDVNAAAPGDGALKALRPGNPYQALGMAVAFLMADPAFQELQFGHWARVLAGQVRRGHYLFVVHRDRVVGFAGWSLTDHDRAEAWLAGRGELAFEDSQAGDCVILNVWKATTPAANRLLVDAFRRMFRHKEALYYKRFYADGRRRRARLRVNEAVDAHIADRSADR
jgi:hemolysin-activating ACP:hemolysin acyltransferase